MRGGKNDRMRHASTAFELQIELDADFIMSSPGFCPFFNIIIIFYCPETQHTYERSHFNQSIKRYLHSTYFCILNATQACVIHRLLISSQQRN